MRVLYVACECKPFSKVGGVGDVAGELPPALRAEGVEIEIATPLYPDAMGAREDLEPAGIVSEVAEDGVIARAGWRRAALGDVPVFLCDSPAHFRGPVYVNSPPDRPYFDDARRFSFFSAACVDLIRERQPDVVHANDWALGYLLGLLRSHRMPQARVLTTHNVQYQGNFAEALLDPGSILGRLLDDHGDDFRDPHRDWHCVNALRLGMVSAHRNNTVSPTYAREMTEPPDEDRYFLGGCGIETIARGLYPEKLVGILNGFRYQTEPTAQAFEAALARKSEARARLGREFGDPGGLLLGFVGRAVEQKVRLLTEPLRGTPVLEHILAIPGVNVAVLGTGDRPYEEFLRKAAGARGGARNYSATIRFDRERAALVSQGCDVFLMPSLFEPCGIAQMESMANATPPLVRRTGGLADTVTPHTQADGTGFVFDGDTREGLLRALVEAVRQAAELHRANGEAFRTLQWNCFRRRFTWKTPARRYIEEVYQPAMNDARRA